MHRLLISVLFLCLLMSTAHAQQTPYNIALDRIEVAKETPVVELDLSGLGLTELPPEIGNLTNLEKLWLDHNELTELPPEIGNLTNLQFLSLDQNALTELPHSFGQLQGLQGLSLESNQFSVVPRELFWLPDDLKFTFFDNPVELDWDGVTLESLYQSTFAQRRFNMLPIIASILVVLCLWGGYHLRLYLLSASLEEPLRC